MPNKTIIHITSFFVVLMIIVEYKYHFATIMPILQLLRDGGGNVEARRQQECLERLNDEFRRHKNESILDSTVWNDVKHIILFVGHDRSGTTLVGSLLDAHPNIVVANEYDAIGEWMGFTKEKRTRDFCFKLCIQIVLKVQE